MADDNEIRVIVARYVSLEGKRDDIRAVLLRMADIVREAEPGCLAYAAYQSVEDPDVYVLYEEYESQQAVEAHRKAPHYKELIEGTVVPMLKSRERDIVVPLRR